MLELALDLFGRGQLSESLPHFRLALRINPQDLEARLAYAKVLAQLEDCQSLLECIETGLALHTDEPDIVCALSRQLDANGYARRARLQLESALQRNPEHPEILRELGRIAYKQFLWETALDYWQRCGHFGLISLALEKLGRRGEAYHCWLRFLELGQNQDPELDSFRPCGYNLWNFSIRYDSLLLGHKVSDLQFDGECWYFQADEQVAAAILKDFLICTKVAGWPITRVVAAEEEDAEFALVLAEELGVSGSSDDEFVLHFSRSAERLAFMQIPNGLTFAMTAHQLGPRRGDAPDVTGVAHERKVSFNGLSIQSLRQALQVTPRQVFDDNRFRDNLRPALKLRPGWEERAAKLPRPSEEEPCRRIRAGDRSALDWLDDGEPSQALKQACLEALEVVAHDWNDAFMHYADEMQIWENHPEFRDQLYWKSRAPQAWTAAAILSDDQQLRETAVTRIFTEEWKVSEEVLAVLDLTNPLEATIWLRQQDPQTLGDRINPASHPNLLECMLSFLDESFAVEVRCLMEHPEARVRERAAGYLAEWGQLPKTELLAVCKTPQRKQGLRGVGRCG